MRGTACAADKDVRCDQAACPRYAPGQGVLTFTGGAAKGTLWPQVIADVLGLSVSVPAVTESSALGAALCAGRGAGFYSSLADLDSELRKRAATFEPDPVAVAAYDHNYAAWRHIYQGMLDLSEEGLLNPLWRAAGVQPPSRSAATAAERRQSKGA